MSKKKAIVVLAGGFSRGGKFGWRSSAFNESAGVGVPGSYVRVVAAAALWRESRDAVVVPSGGRGQADKLLPPGLFLSTIMRQELEVLGVPAASVLEENQSGSTFQQLKAIANLAQEHGWQEVVIVSNRYHLPRIKAMVECLEPLALLRPLISYVSAEEVVLADDATAWQQPITRAYASPEFGELARKEAGGVAQIKAGTYLHAD